MADDKEGERVTKESSQGRVIRKMTELKEHPDARAAGLQEAEILALQLYTGLHSHHYTNLSEMFPTEILVGRKNSC